MVSRLIFYFILFHLFRIIFRNDLVIPKLFVFILGIPMPFQGMVSLVSTDGLHQLHIFVFFLAVFHVTFSAITMSLGRAKVRVYSSGSIQLPVRNFQKYTRISYIEMEEVREQGYKLEVTLKFSVQPRIWKEWEKDTSSITYEFSAGSVSIDYILFHML
jgi:hypothetical protein